ncbi:hypothetical protein KUCAC02_021356, partial [Chaenocephalus aceratus]
IMDICFLPPPPSHYLLLSSIRNHKDLLLTTPSPPPPHCAGLEIEMMDGMGAPAAGLVSSRPVPSIIPRQQCIKDSSLQLNLKGETMTPGERGQ